MLKKKQKVLMALSGGIDSAVSAYLLLKQGYEVEAAFMKNWSSTKGLKHAECPWLKDRQDALRVAAFLRISMHTLDFEKEYGKKVLDYFFKEYASGRTPNPDVMCNKEIKFKLLYDWAIRKGFDYLATGHYAKIVDSGQWTVDKKFKDYPLLTNHYSLIRSADEFKDQTYFIYNIKTEQLPHLLFPIGGMKKSQVRTLARKIGLPNAEKKESMGLCFVGKIRLKDFLEQKLKAKKGEIVLSSSLSSRPTASASERERRDPLSSDTRYARLDSRVKGFLDSSQSLLARNDKKEAVIGHHNGLHNYTIGQRQGIHVGANGPYFVFGKDMDRNRLLVTNNPNDERLLVKEVQVHSVNWLEPEFRLNIQNAKLSGRYRHQGKLAPVTVSQIKKDLYRVAFKLPQKAIASGQSLVFYRVKQCVGGGVIV